MTRSKRMQPIARLAADRERQAARDLGASRREFEAQRVRLGELQGYRDDYAARFRSASAQGIDAAQLRDFHAFIARLNEAIAQQERLVTAARREWEACAARWQGLRTRTQALDRVVERLQQGEAREVRRREQGDSDERAQRPRPDPKET